MTCGAVLGEELAAFSQGLRCGRRAPRPGHQIPQIVVGSAVQGGIRTINLPDLLRAEWQDFVAGEDIDGTIRISDRRAPRGRRPASGEIGGEVRRVEVQAERDIQRRFWSRCLFR